MVKNPEWCMNHLTQLSLDPIRPAAQGDTMIKMHQVNRYPMYIILSYTKFKFIRLYYYYN